MPLDKVLCDHDQYVPSVPCFAIQKDGTFAPEPELPDIRPDREKPFPADIVEGMHHASAVLIEAAKSVAGSRPLLPMDKQVGVTLLQVATAVNEGDPAAARDSKERWRKSRSPKLPKAIGKDPVHSQANLYEPAAIVEWLKKVETFDKPKLLQALTAIARAPRQSK